MRVFASNLFIVAASFLSGELILVPFGFEINWKLFIGLVIGATYGMAVQKWLGGDHE